MRQLARNGLCVAAVVFLLGSTAFAHPALPEIDPATGTAALVLLGGAFAVIRGWRRR